MTIWRFLQVLNEITYTLKKCHCIQCKFLLDLISAFVRFKVKLDARFDPLAQVTLTCFRRSGVFIVNFKHISHLFLVFLLMTWNK